MTSLRTKALSLVALLALGVVGCTPATDTGSDPAPSSASQPATGSTESAAPSASAEPAAPAEPAAAGTALDQLAGIPIKGRAPKTGYDREQFGPAWADTDRNGCDTRNDILARDLVDIVYKDGTQECVVASGTFLDPYTGTTIAFVRGNTTSTAVQIDHVVALSDAWQKGAQQLSAEERRQLANDPLNLMAADGPANGSKSDGDAATWLPANKAFRCEYVARQTAVKAEYRLWMTQAEHDAIAAVLSGCPDEPVPARDGTVPAAAVAAADAAQPAEEAQPAPAVEPVPAAPAVEPAPAAPAGTVYANCTAVKAAGVAPIRPGDAGWDPKFDRDGDGVGCTS
ncbi:DUF1524 domain-containing protein [Arthrobacter sp. zg-Y1110]|uniref:GmrSD restriction endonuclease domain-containing protein n=1 Tax=Arthrobacter sp. zg-Y1110 TaxID=2886932 RepID=UPI001D151583|nr:DUF1524 domain-containing protein [Arthrobacter sp. zg-Y1110]MCC3291721.1 DUF1524 domain-containing protein [Arthrobacter sp. zg-Y1110]UWX85563.1 DUF1524 domain-containing protein [Arthrobacter sp. zg-Y1110]